MYPSLRPAEEWRRCDSPGQAAAVARLRLNWSNASASPRWANARLGITCAAAGEVYR
jgi:hypothetical protein